MEAMLMRISGFLWVQGWQVALLTVIVGLLSWALLNRSAHVRYLLWLIVLAKCVVPPVHTVRLPVLPQGTAALPAWSEPAGMRPIVARGDTMQASGQTPRQVPTDAIAPTVEPMTIKPQGIPRLATRAWFGMAWTTGLGVFAVIVAVKGLGTGLWLRRERKTLPGSLADEINCDLAAFGMRHTPRVWLIDGVGQPFVWGFVHASIYLPLGFGQMGDRQGRRNLLGHELCHVLRLDAAVNAVQVMVQGVFWFHPLVWWANKRIRAEREKCCDEMAVARLGAPAKEYSTAIVNMLMSEHRSTQPIPSLAVAGPVNNIEERIKTMMRPGMKFYGRPSWAAAVGVLLIACVTIPISLLLTTQAEGETGLSTNKNVPVAPQAGGVAATDRATLVREGDVFVDPKTGIKFKKVKAFAGPNDVIGLPRALELSPNGKFLLEADGLGIVPLAGGKPFKLVDLHGVELGSWSPDSKKVAFRAWPGLGEGAIWVVRVDPDTAQPTAPPKKLVECPLRDRLRWAPDSERIIFRRDDKETKAALWWTVSIDDGTLTQIGDFSTVGIPSPDGENVVYSENPTYRGMVGGPGKPLWVKNTKGGPARKIDDGATPWCWSADSKWVCCYDRDRPCFVRIADGYKVNVTVGLNVPEKMGWPIPSSLDGKKMWFYRTSLDSRRVLKVVSASGGPAYELGTRIGGGNKALIWSPDNQAVIIDGGYNDNNPNLKALPLDGGKPVSFRKDVSIPGSWFLSRLSPDSKNLLIAADDNEGADGPWDVWVIPVSWQEMRTTGPAVLVFKGWNTSDYGGPAYYAFWSPDGKRITLADRRGSIYVVPVAGGDPVRLTTGSEARWFYWSPDGKMIAFVRVREGTSSLVQVVSSTGGEAKTVCSMVQGTMPIDDILWSPDSQALIMMRDQDLVSVSIADGSTRSLINMRDLGEAEASVFRLSSDGTTLAFFGFTNDGRYEDDQLFLLDMKSGKVNPLMPVGGRLIDYRWSPNGNWIASIDEEFYNARSGSVLWEMDIEEALTKLAK